MSLSTVSWILTLLFPLPAAACWSQAAEVHDVSAHLLHAIAEVESSLDPRARNERLNGHTRSYDIGRMQINSAHLRALARYGIDEQSLLDPCINIHVGAWLLARSFERHGLSWDSVGAYNASCTRLQGNACIAARTRYAWKVYRRLYPLGSAEGNAPAVATRVAPFRARRLEGRAPILRHLLSSTTTSSGVKP